VKGGIRCGLRQITALFCVQINGHNLTFSIVDNTTDFYQAAFPNFAELLPADTVSGSTLLNDFDRRDTFTLVNPSGRVMPAEYFMYLELPPLTPTFGPPTSIILQDAVNVATGFR